MTYPVVPLKRVLSRNDGGVWGDDPTGLDDSVVLRSTDQSADGEWLDVEPALRSLTPIDRIKARLLAGDLLLTKSSGSALHIGKTTLVTRAIAESQPAYSNFMQRLRVAPDNVPRFYWYCFRSEFVRDQLNLISTTTTGLANLNASTINELAVPSPLPVQQRQIADYLDAQSAKSDALIGKQERLIETLAERRQAMIGETLSAASTLPGASEPRIELLGRVSSEIIDCLHTTADQDPDGDYLVARTSSVRNGSFHPNGTYAVSRRTYDERVAKGAPKPGDVLLTREAPSGESCLVPVGTPLCLGQRMVLIRPRRAELHPQLVVWNMYMPHVRRYLDVETSGSGVQNLTMPRIRRLPMIVPPLERQDTIVAELYASTARVDALAAKAREMINVLKERRQALISAAVTGKIDVRGLA